MPLPEPTRRSPAPIARPEPDSPRDILLAALNLPGYPTALVEMVLNRIECRS